MRDVGSGVNCPRISSTAVHFTSSSTAFSRTLSMGLALGMVLASGCSQCDIPVHHVDRAGTTEETVAQLAISGMMCEIACVSKVRKELYDLPGVTRADIQFDADRKVDTALVVFDPNVVAPETLIATVEEIGGGLYDVEMAEVVHYAPESSR